MSPQGIDMNSSFIPATKVLVLPKIINMTTITLQFKVTKEQVLLWYVQKFGEPEIKYKLKAYHSEYSDNWHVIKTCRHWHGLFFTNQEVHWVVFNQKGEVMYEK